MTIKEFSNVLESSGFELSTTFLDSLTAVPFGAIISGLCKVGIDVSNALLIRKFEQFLNPVSDIQDEVDAFLGELSSDKKDKLGEYMLSLLSSAESTEKARIMGLIFRAAVLKEIDREMMLRLVSIVGRSFVHDLKELPNYLDETEEFSIASNEFINLGLIDNEVGGIWKDAPSVKLNEVGEVLCQILSSSGWFDDSNAC